MTRATDKKSLAEQCLLAALAAAYVGALASFMLFQIWRYRTGADATFCPIGSNDLSHWCGIGELSFALLFDFLWALYGLPFALVLTIPSAFGLGFFAPWLEGKLSSRSQLYAQYGLATALGLLIGSLLGEPLSGLAGALAGAWTFRHARYSNAKESTPYVEKNAGP